MGIERPADIARRAREMADKRDQQAALTGNTKIRDQLLETARNYRALAEAMDRELPPLRFPGNPLLVEAPKSEP